MLLIAQSVALGVAAVPLHLLGRGKLKNGWLAFLVAVAYLAHPAKGWTNFEQFHPDVFEALFVLVALHMMIKQR